MRLDQLDPGDRFQVATIEDLRGRLLRTGPGSATVRWETGTEVKLPGGKTFTRPASATTISLGTEVLPLEGATC